MSMPESGEGVERIADRIRQAMPSLTGAERKVARRLLAQEATVGLESSVVLASKAGVSGPTVTRFVKKLGFSDYADFQSAIRTEIDARFVSPVDLLRAGAESSEGGTPRYGAGLAESVRLTMAGLADHEFETACGLLANPKHSVMTVGGWTTGVLARHLATQLQQVRGHVHYAGESPSDVSSWVADAGPRLTTVLFDIRRYEERTIALAHALRARSAQIIVVTDTWLSPVSELADVVLPASVQAGLRFDSVVPALAIVEALVDRTARLLGAAALQRFQTYNAFSVAVAPRWGSDPDEPSALPDVPSQKGRS